MFSKIRKIDAFIQKTIPTQEPASKALIEISKVGEYRVPNYSYLGPSFHFKGDLTLDENLRIEGEVEGKIRVTGKKLSIGQQARITAEIHAGAVEVRGTAKGDIYGEELVHIYSTAVVNGTVHSERVIVEDGAHLNGRVEMRKKEETVSTEDSEPKVTSIAADVANVG